MLCLFLEILNKILFNDFVTKNITKDLNANIAYFKKQKVKKCQSEVVERYFFQVRIHIIERQIFTNMINKV